MIDPLYTHSMLALGSRPRVVVCERRGLWAAALRRHGPAWAAAIGQTRSPAEADELLAKNPGGFAVVELSAFSLAATLEWMEAIGRARPLARLAAVGVERWGAAGRLAIAAGAVCVVDSWRRLGPLGAAIGRHLARSHEPPRGLAERVWAELPWTDAADR